MYERGEYGKKLKREMSTMKNSRWSVWIENTEKKRL